MKKFIQIALAIGFALSSTFVHPQTVQPTAAATPAPAADAPSVVPPDQQATKEQVAKLFEVMHLREQYASMMKMFPAMIQQQMRQQEKETMASLPGGGQDLDPKLQSELNGVVDRYIEKAMSLYPVDEMLDDVAAIYQRHFTREDVDAYIAFYSTPAGQHFLQMTPVIMKEYMPLVMQRTQERSKDLISEMVKELADVTKSITPPAAKPSTPAPK